MPEEDLKRYELAQRAARILKTTDLWLLPTINPDGQVKFIIYQLLSFTVFKRRGFFHNGFLKFL